MALEETLRRLDILVAVMHLIVILGLFGMSVYALFIQKKKELSKTKKILLIIILWLVIIGYAILNKDAIMKGLAYFS